MNSGLTVEYFCEMEDCLASVIIPILDKPSEYGWVENHIWPSPWVICPKHAKTFQLRVHEWVMDCFGKESAFFVRERFDRFIEDSVEFAQSFNISKKDVQRMVDYVYSEKEPGKPVQELGGVMVTLAALCEPVGLDMNGSGEMELKRVKHSIESIRAKNENKPRE